LNLQLIISPIIIYDQDGHPKTCFEMSTVIRRFSSGEDPKASEPNAHDANNYTHLRSCRYVSKARTDEQMSAVSLTIRTSSCLEFHNHNTANPATAPTTATRPSLAQLAKFAAPELSVGAAAPVLVVGAANCSTQETNPLFD
jgi:hypothetical protein